MPLLRIVIETRQTIAESRRSPGRRRGGRATERPLSWPAPHVRIARTASSPGAARCPTERLNRRLASDKAAHASPADRGTGDAERVGATAVSLENAVAVQPSRTTPEPSALPSIQRATITGTRLATRSLGRGADGGPPPPAGSPPAELRYPRIARADCSARSCCRVAPIPQHWARRFPASPPRGRPLGAPE